MTDQIRSKARELLQSGAASCVIGYEQGPRQRVRPAFIYAPQDADRLLWDQRCTHNLTVYLTDMFKAQDSQASIAIVAKPCDTKAIQVLQAEERLDRSRLHVIGVACEGILEGAGYGATQSAALQARCQSCDTHMPLTADTQIGAAPAIEPQACMELHELEALSQAERASYWLQQFDRCIRCYACRQACPMCDCPTCMFERDDSLWVGLGSGLREKRMFHLGRAFHLAGRCIGCDECQRACPMDIPVGMLNRKLAEVMQDFFQFTPGMRPEPSPLTTLVQDESLEIAEKGYAFRRREEGPQ